MARTTAFAVSLFVLLSASTLRGQEYEIRLSPHARIGDRYRVSTTARHTEKMVAFAGNAAVSSKEEQFAVELVSFITVLATNNSGRIIKSEIAIEKCLITAGGETKPLLPGGTVVISMLEGNKTVFKINGVPVDPMTEKAMRVAVPTYQGGPSDDEVFGTSEKKKIGESWDINADLVVQSLKESFNISTAKQDVKGAAMLEGVVKTGQEEYLVISASLDIDNFSVPLPTGFKIQNGKLQTISSGRFPADHARQRVADSTKLALSFTAMGSPDPQTPAMTVQGAMERSRTSEFELVK